MAVRDALAWAQVLKDEWQARSNSPRSRFYIASHPGWDDESAWQNQAEIDAGFVLFGIPDAELAKMKVLEIGCGNGRLVRYVASRVARYHGFDICPAYVSEARDAHTKIPHARFLEGNGARIPSDFGDEGYDLIYAAAVFIHCPLEVIESYLQDALKILKPKGRLRFQVLADPEDQEGFVPLEAIATAAAEQNREFYDSVVQEHAEAAEHSLLEESHYEGKKFGYREFLSFADSLLPASAELHVMRFDPLILNCEIQLN